MKNIFSLSCKRASELIDQRSEKRLSLSERLLLKVHTGLCGACGAYKKQSRFIDKLFGRHYHGEDTPGNTSMDGENKELKQKIISRL